MWDCSVLLGVASVSPGETQRAGIAFLSGEKAASIFRLAGTFYLWDGRIIGEAKIVSS